jgi:DNA-directed RNA polymerase specialized sigma24 family protein
MVEARQEIARHEFESVTRTLVARAKLGSGRISRISEADAEDVVQDAWEKELRRNEELPSGPRLLPHLHEAVVDTSAEHRRRRRRKREVPQDRLVALDAAPEAAEVLGGNTEEQALAAIRVGEIFDAMHTHLDDEAVEYTVLDALDFQEKEIAAALDMAPSEPGAARKRVSRARGAIAKSINRRLETNVTAKEDH